MEVTFFQLKLVIATVNMKKLIFLTTCLFSISTHAQTTCPSDPALRWHNCVGTYTDANGDKYVGEWQDNSAHGQGTKTYANGSKYVGEYQDGEYHGQGTYTWVSGSKYVGEWQDSKFHGQGTYTWVSGSKYVGEYQDGEYHGQGTYTYANGTIERGYYMRGEFVPEICEGMGLSKGTEAFGNCVVKLIDKIN